MFTHEGVFKELDVALETIKSRGDVADSTDVGQLQQIFRDPRWRALAKVRTQGLLLDGVCVCLSAGYLCAFVRVHIRLCMYVRIS